MRISDWSSDVCSSDLDQKAEWSLSFVQEGAPPRKITVDDANGIAQSGSAREQGETTARLMRRIHDGTGMGLLWQELGRASCRERVCQYVSLSVSAVCLKTDITKHIFGSRMRINPSK